MGKAEILAALTKLSSADRREIADRILELEMLDRELEEYRKNPYEGSSWEEVVARVRQSL